MAFSKSESRRISRVPSMRAAEAACRISRPPLKGEEGVPEGGEDEEEGGVSPRSIKTSQTRSWAGKGME